MSIPSRIKDGVERRRESWVAIEMVVDMLNHPICNSTTRSSHPLELEMGDMKTQHFNFNEIASFNCRVCECVCLDMLSIPTVDSALALSPPSSQWYSNNMTRSYSYNDYGAFFCVLSNQPFCTSKIDSWWWCDEKDVWMQIKNNLNDNSFKITLFTAEAGQAMQSEISHAN